MEVELEPGAKKLFGFWIPEGGREETGAGWGIPAGQNGPSAPT